MVAGGEGRATAGSRRRGRGAASPAAAFDAVAYVFLMVKDLEPLAAQSGDQALIQSLRRARIAAARALKRMGQGGGG
jgi:hypothetical protein